MKREIAETGSLVGALGAAFASAVAAICCIGPLALTVLGVNGMILAAGLKPYRFHLLGASALMLVLAFWMIYRPPQIAGASCPTRFARFSKVIFWCAAILWLTSFILQFVADRVIL